MGGWEASSGTNPLLELFELAMGPRSASRRPKHALMAFRDISLSVGNIHTSAFHVVHSMGPIVAVMYLQGGKTHSRKADQSTKPCNGTVYV